MARTKARTTLATIGVTALALGGCANIRSNEYSDERTETAAVTEIAIAGGSGSVTVKRGEAGSPIQIQREFHYRGAQRPKGRDRVEGTQLRLDTDCGNGCSVTFVVSTPAEVAISGHNGAGRVELESVGAVNLELTSGTLVIRHASANVTAQTGSGTIDIEDVKGAVTATAGSGDIRIARSGGLVTGTTRSGKVDVRDAGGDTVTAGAQSGEVSVTLSKPQLVHAQTKSGAIRVAVPAGMKVNAHTNTRSGHSSITAPVAADAPTNLDLTTASGDISVVTA